MKILDHDIKFGLTWDELQPLLAKGTRESLEKPDENTWVGVYKFSSEHLKLKVVFKREEGTPYKLVDYDML